MHRFGPWLVVLIGTLVAKDASAQYACEDERVASPSAALSKEFGTAVACSDSWMFVTSQHDAGGIGWSVQVYRRTGTGDWAHIGALPLPASVTLGDRFGERLSLSGDRLAVSAPNHDGNGKDTGAVWIYERQGAAWNQVVKLNGPALVTPTTQSPNFGMSLDLEGNLLAVGAPSHVQATFNGQGQITSQAATGAAFVYRRSATGTWSLDKTFLPSAPFVNEGLGAAVALEGQLVHIGVPGRLASGIKVGTVEIFERVGAGNWPKVKQLLPPTFAANSGFGTAIAAVGTDLAVTAIGQRRVHCYVRSPDDTFTIAQSLAPSLSPFADPGDFGRALALNGDTLLVGAPEHPQDAVDTNDEGVVYMFDRSAAGVWFASLAFVSTAVGDTEGVGASFAVTSDHIVYGAPLANDLGPSEGAVLVARRGSLYHDFLEDSTVFPRGQTLLLRAGSSWKGAFYLVLGSLSGTTPGIEIAPGTLLPLVYDPYMELTLDLLAPLDDPFDVLKTNGDREARFETPTGLFPAFTGLHFHHAFIAVHPTTYEVFVSNTVPLRLFP